MDHALKLETLQSEVLTGGSCTKLETLQSEVLTGGSCTEVRDTAV